MAVQTIKRFISKGRIDLNALDEEILTHFTLSIVEKYLVAETVQRCLKS